MQFNQLLHLYLSFVANVIFGTELKQNSESSLLLSTKVVSQNEKYFSNIKCLSQEDDNFLRKKKMELNRWKNRDEQKSYKNYKLYRLDISGETTKKQQDTLTAIQKGPYEFWSPFWPKISGLHYRQNVNKSFSIDVLVGPAFIAKFQQTLDCANISRRILSEDLQKTIQDENNVSAVIKSSEDKRHWKRQVSLGGLIRSFIRNAGPSRKSRKIRPTSFSQFPAVSTNLGICALKTGMNWDAYHSSATFNMYINCLARTYPEVVQLFPIGKSFQGRPLEVVSVTSPEKHDRNKNNKVSVWLDGGMHAREWISPAAVTYILHQLVEGQEYELQNMLQFVNFYILPLANPDGYEYSRIKDRLWRKTRSTGHGTNFLGGACFGVDPNRNWSFKWGGKGSSNNPCDETFRGPRPFSEPETESIRNFILSRSPQILMYLTIHSYGQYLLYPWGFDDDLVTEDKKQLHSIAEVGANSVYKHTGRTYTVGPAAQMLYPASGGSDDWAKGVGRIKYAYTLELPDTGIHGFILPARYIREIGEELLGAVSAMTKEIIKIYIGI